MFDAIAQQLGAAFKAQGVPFPVVYAFGGEPTDAVSIGARERVVLDEPIDRKGDQVIVVRGAHVNPKQPWRCVDVATIRIFARSPVAGARPHDHAARAKQVRGHVIAELDQIVRVRGNVIAFGPSGFVTPADASGSQSWSGAIYELEISIDRGVSRVTWKGEAGKEVTIGTDVQLSTELAEPAVGGV